MNHQAEKQTPENRVKEAVIEQVGKNGEKQTPLDLERIISADFGLKGRTARKIVKSLVSENRLAYTQQFGRTFVEISRNRPVHVGKGVILAPPDIPFTPGHGQILVRIAPGASFGMGDHPTTRIALQLTSGALHENALPCRPEHAKVIDIGTGTGVLAIAACLMGAQSAVGIDTDPCARSEAAQNIRLNGLQDRILVDSGDRFENYYDKRAFSLILANLRYPSLAGMYTIICRLAKPGGLLICSGFRPHETADLVEIYTSCGFRHIDTLTENNWCGITLKLVSSSHNL